MTTFTINPRVTPDPTNFTVTGTVGGVTLKWSEANDDEAFGAEVWSSTTNNRANATKIAEVAVGSYYHELAAGTTRYYWIRGKNTYGYTTGNWVPASATGGTIGISPGAGTNDIAVGAVSNVIFTGSYDGGGYNTNDQNLAAFPVSVSGTALPGSGSINRIMKVFSRSSTSSAVLIDFNDYLSCPTLDLTNLPGNGNFVSVNLDVSIWTVSDINNHVPGTDTQVRGALGWVGSQFNANVFEARNSNGALITERNSIPAIKLCPNATAANWPANTKFRIIVKYTVNASGYMPVPGTFSSYRALLTTTELKR